MTPDELTTIYPRLWHMAMDGSWPSIREHGLLSTSSLLDLYGVDGAARNAIESRRRPQSVPLVSDGMPGATVRDQKPMSDSALKKCLADALTPRDWYESLNHKVFFWLSRERLRGLLEARAYRTDPQVVITLNTASLVESHANTILLSPINSGSTIMKPQPRGKATFLPISDYPFDEWKKKRGGTKDAVAELTVPAGVHDVAKHVLAVHRVHGDKVEQLWRAPDALPDDRP